MPGLVPAMTKSLGGFALQQAEGDQALAHLAADRGKAVMSLDEGLAFERAPLRRSWIIDDRGHGARRRLDVGLGPDLAVVIRIFAGAYGTKS
jgi:hypothetical protein